MSHNRYQGAPIVPCSVQRLGGTEFCTTCGLRWDINDPLPPICPSLAEDEPGGLTWVIAAVLLGAAVLIGIAYFIN